MTQKCPEGKYYCHTMKKCKPIPKGWHVMRGGYLMKDEDHKKKNGKSKSNGNGGSHSNNNGNGNGNGNGSGNGGNGGVSEEASYKDFIKGAIAAKERIEKKRAETRKRNNATVLQDKRSGKGIKFFDKKGSGRMKAGKKVYD
tara:strand:+ start:317 stop:742 length:426 start_codon:yes stop_codon:yes gene_type:complete